MSEAIIDTGRRVVCQECGAVIGKIFRIGRGYRVIIGAARLWALHGECCCGAALHWTGSDAALEKLTEHYAQK